MMLINDKIDKTKFNNISRNDISMNKLFLNIGCESINLFHKYIEYLHILDTSRNEKSHRYKTQPQTQVGSGATIPLKFSPL